MEDLMRTPAVMDGTAGNRDFVLNDSCNESVKSLERAMARIAPTNLPILLVGECGTGKAFVAHRIHQLSSRKQEPYARAICSGLTAEMVESHFARPADGNSVGEGTLFLKQVGELSSESQRRLLWAIPEGDSNSGEDFAGPRLISSTTVDLEGEVSAGRFRRELLYRLKGACLHLLPLRKRKEDVLPLAEMLLTKHSTLQGRPRPALGAEDLALLQEWHWPGNIRELENVIKQIVILNDAKGVLLELLGTPEEHRAPQTSSTSGLALRAVTRAASRRVEEQMILEALEKTRWNRKRAAQDLRISYKSLLSKLKQISSDRLKKD
jgi:DNA-binding NtrC family response regulator